MKVLIIEDDGGISEVLCMFISTLDGLECVSARNTEIGKQKIELEKPEVIFLDLLIDGELATDVIAFAREKLPTARIYVISALNAAEQIATEYKADGFLAKPFALERIEEIIKQKI